MRRPPASGRSRAPSSRRRHQRPTISGPARRDLLRFSAPMIQLNAYRGCYQAQYAVDPHELIGRPVAGPSATTAKVGGTIGLPVHQDVNPARPGIHFGEVDDERRGFGGQRRVYRLGQLGALSMSTSPASEHDGTAVSFSRPRMRLDSLDRRVARSTLYLKSVLAAIDRRGQRPRPGLWIQPAGHPAAPSCSRQRRSAESTEPTVGPRVKDTVRIGAVARPQRRGRHHSARCFRARW